MDAIRRLREENKLPGSYLDCLVDKARVSQRRKTKFNSDGNGGVRTRWVNRTGTYRHPEWRVGPKYWHGRKPVRPANSIKTYKDFATAVRLIAAGEKNHTDYQGVSGINRERLKLAQSWRDREIGYDISDILRLSLPEIKKELGFGRARYGLVH